MNKAIPFLENLKPLIDKTIKTGVHLFDLLIKCPLGKIKSDRQAKYSRNEVVRLFVLMKILAIPNIGMAITSQLKNLVPCGKDVLYKILNSGNLIWRSMLYRQAAQCTNGITVESEATEPLKQPCFIIDDSDINKKGKRMEFNGRIFSHVTKRYDLGFKCLNLAYWSGKHLLHLDFSLHGELEKHGAQGMTQKQLLKSHIFSIRKKNCLVQIGVIRSDFRFIVLEVFQAN